MPASKRKRKSYDDFLSWQDAVSDTDSIGGYSIVLICVECKDGHDPGNKSGTRMEAVKGSFLADIGFIFQCPRCGYRVAAAHVEERFKEKIEARAAASRKNSKNA